MDSTQDLINEKNYVLREIKEIRGVNNINQENVEMIDNFTEIHEIKDIKQKQIQPKKYSNIPKSNEDVGITLERETISKKIKQNIMENVNKKENINKENKIKNLCPDCKGEILYPRYKKENLYPECKEEKLNKEILCDECKKGNFKEINEEDNCIKFGIVEAPFLETKDENDLESDNINNLMEAIFELLKSDDILKDFDNLRITFKTMEENDKNEIIEGIKIKIENEDQQKRFNNLLKYLN